MKSGLPTNLEVHLQVDFATLLPSFNFNTDGRTDGLTKKLAEVELDLDVPNARGRVRNFNDRPTR